MKMHQTDEFIVPGAGWCISLFCLLQLPIWGFFAVINQKEKVFMKKVYSAFKPNSSWGPNDPEKSETIVGLQYFLSRM